MRFPPSLLAALSCLVTSACGQEEGPTRQPSAEEVTAALNHARADLAAAAVEPEPAQRLGVITPGELEPRFRARPSCRLSRAGALFLAWVPSGAVAKVDGKITPLERGGAVDPAGGFFKGPGVTVSIGRLQPISPAAEVPGVARAAGVTVGGQPDLQKLKAEWTCFW